MLVFGLLFVHLLLGTIAKFKENEGVEKAAGYFGIFCAAAAIYTAAAGVINESFKKVVLPVGGGEKCGDPVKTRKIE